MSHPFDRQHAALTHGRPNWTGFIICSLLAAGGFVFALKSLMDFVASTTGSVEANAETQAAHDEFLKLARAAVRIDADRAPESALEGRLVVVTGSLTADAPATDPEFGIVAENAVLLRRDVAVLQNVSMTTTTRERDPAGFQPWLGDNGFDQRPSRFRTTTSVSSSLAWKPAHTVHPDQRRVDDARFPAPGIRIGVIPISNTLARRLNATMLLEAGQDTMERITSPLRGEISVQNGALFIGSGDKEGHWRMDYAFYPKGEATVLATLHEGLLDVHPDQASGRTVALSAPGRHEAAALNPHSLDAIVAVESQWGKFLTEMRQDPLRIKDYNEGRRLLIGLAVFLLFSLLAWFNWPLRRSKQRGGHP
ncbi:MAG TPA: hypothetical protein DDZ88_14710 [Verrucomicrobiales bacterium]|nr:hypothetical protein [Verrucomicrobiales bacterium]